MSLWTPDGERPVNRQPAAPADDGPGVDELLELVAAANGVPLDALPADARAQLEQELAALSPEDRAQMVQAIEAEASMRAQLAEAPAAAHLVSWLKAMGDQTAAYLEADPPKFADAATMITAVDALVDAVGDQLGPSKEPAAAMSAQLKQIVVTLKQEHDDGIGVAPRTVDDASAEAD
ncbi:MAG: hypothetical protein ACKO04_11150 [Actinomycetes bacterium]